MSGRDPLTGRVLGEFVLREQIGEGGFGAVYRCEQPLLGREAVVKVLHHRLRASDVVRQRFMREAQLASRLDHPYAAHVYAFGVERDDGLCWIAMEMVQGTALDAWLRERGPLPLEQLVPFLERVAEVVQTAHERGIVHRDLKPSNIMVIERAGRLLPKLLDFGIAKVFDPEASARPRRATPPPRSPMEMAPTAPDTGGDGDTDRGPRVEVAAEETTVRATPRRASEPAPIAPAPIALESSDPLTRADAAIGSPPYMAPEQWTDATRVGPSADLYALAIVAYEALAGHRPFVAPTVAALADLHCNAPVPPLGEAFAPALDRFFERALAKRPEERPATSLELVAMLRVAAGIGSAPEDLPRLDEGIRDVWLADAPQPLAEAVATLDAARNVHQARDAARDLLRGLVRYLGVLALAARAQVRGDRDDPALRELLRAVRRRDFDEDERVRLVRLLVQPFASRRGAHPIPELVDLIGRAPGDDPLDAALRVRPVSEQAGSEDVVRSQLAQFMPVLARLLRAAAFVLDHVLVVPRERAPERWMGIRRPRRTLAVVRDLALADDQPALLDREGRPALVLWPLVQALPPTVGADRELFVFDGRGRRGARLVAAPAGFEHDGAAVWDWYGEHVLGEIEGEAEARADDRPPYLGLAAFSASDADRFVGREREIEAFVNRLRKEPLLIVVGPSGAGKSSFVHAGVVPNLPAGWRTIAMRPGGAPVATLTGKLAQASGDAMRVVIVDQLEELFTLVPSTDERTAFAALLAQLSADADSASRVICTVRDDFLMNVESLVPLRPALSRAMVLLGNPSREDLVRTIVEPARRCGYELSDPELARDMVEVVADRPGALALLSFTASRLWDLRDRRFLQLTRKAHDAMGGVAGALGQHAEETFCALGAEDQRVARAAFRQLVTTDNTRAVLTQAELRQRLASPRADAVIDRLVAARLLAVVDGDGESHVELVHEALIPAWPRLEQWTREDLDDRRTRELVRAAAKQWEDRNRARELLWRGELLVELQGLRGRARLSDLEAAFADASQRDAARSRRTTQIVAGGAFAVLLAGVVGLLFLTARIASQRERAEVAAASLHDNLERQFENQGRRLVLDGSPLEALAYLAKAEELGAKGPIHDFLFAHAVQASDGEAFELHQDAGVLLVRFSHSGALLASETLDRTVHVWDARTRALRYTLPVRSPPTRVRFTFSPDDATLLTTSDDGAAILWNTATGTELRRFAQHGPLVCARFSADGALVITSDGRGELAVWDAATGARRLALAGDGTAVVHCDVGRTRLAARDRKGTTRIWTLATGARAGELHGSPMERGTIALSPDEAFALTIDGAKVTVWDVATGRALHELAHDGSINAAEWSPDGTRIATASDDHTATVWDARTGTRLHVIAGHTAGVRRASFSPTGGELVTAGEEGSVLLWNALTGEREARWLGHTGLVYDVDFTADGSRVGTAGDDGRVIVWRAEPQQRVTWLRGHTRYIEAAKFSPDGSRVVTSSLDGTARMWDAHTGRELAVFPMQGGEVPDASFSHDGRWIATAGVTGVLQIWDANTGAPVATLLAGNDAVFQVAWSPDDAQLASVDADGRIRCWTVATRALRFEIRGRPGTVSSIDFAPDGRAVLTTSSDDVIRAWSLDGALVSAFPAPDHPYTAVFDRSGTRVLGAVRAGAAIWRFPSGLRERELVGHVGFVSSAGFSPDGATAITAASDGTARIWDASTGDELAIFRPPGRARTAAFSPDGTRVVIGNDDGTAAIYDLPHDTRSPAERARLLACRVPYVVAGDRLASRSRRCE